MTYSYTQQGARATSEANRLTHVERGRAPGGLQERLAAVRARIVPTMGDGNCFFHAMVTMLNQIDSSEQFTHLTLRQLAWEWVFNHRWSDPQVGRMLLALRTTGDEWVTTMMTPGIYADELAVYAMGEVLQVNIEIVQTRGVSTPVRATNPQDVLIRSTILLGNYSGLHFVATKPLSKRKQEEREAGEAWYS